MEGPLPNLVIAGVNKAGTTSLFSAMTRHRDVAGSDVKETCHFLPLRYGEPLPPLSRYREHFAGVHDASVVMEATPGYFYGGAPLVRALDEALPDARVVVAFREPVARLVSFFRFQKAMLELPRDLSADDYVERCLAYSSEELVGRRELNPWFGVEGGYYDRYLAPWRQVLGARLRVVFFDDIAARPNAVLADLGGWLGLDPSGWPDDTMSRENRTIAPRNRALHRVALTANKLLEVPFRRHPVVKARLRSLYSRLNTTASLDDLSPSGRRQLVERYREPNAALAATLRSMGSLDLPGWLDDSD